MPPKKPPKVNASATKAKQKKIARSQEAAKQRMVMLEARQDKYDAKQSKLAAAEGVCCLLLPFYVGCFLVCGWCSHI
jgi:hypothetical protein